MFQIIKPGTRLNFVGQFPWTSILSAVLVVAALTGLFTKMRYGVDFSGGAEVQVKFSEAIQIDQLRRALQDKGFQVTVQRIGEEGENEYLLKVPSDAENLGQVTQSLRDALSETYTEQEMDIRKVDIVGPRAGAELRLSGIQAMLWALLAIMVYIGLRFDFKYSPGAIAALFHDVVIILGLFALLELEFTLQIVAALLAVIGYSVNDTVIVYDRVREHDQKYPERTLKDHINSAVNETMSRTILTSGTTLFISVTMFFFGGLAIRDFFLAISLGVLIGTYSSIFVAAPVTLFFDRFKKS